MSSSQQKRFGVIQRLLQVSRHPSRANRLIRFKLKIGFSGLTRGGNDHRLVQEGTDVGVIAAHAGRGSTTGADRLGLVHFVKLCTAFQATHGSYSALSLNRTGGFIQKSRTEKDWSSIRAYFSRSYRRARASKAAISFIGLLSSSSCGLKHILAGFKP
jgi:hypothetical protein